MGIYWALVLGVLAFNDFSNKFIKINVLIYFVLLHIKEQKELEKEKEQLQRQLKKRQRQQEKQLKREAYEALERQKKMMADETDKALKGQYHDTSLLGKIVDCMSVRQFRSL